VQVIGTRPPCGSQLPLLQSVLMTSPPWVKPVLHVLLQRALCAAWVQSQLALAGK
jgi:hypothetical protein